MSNKREREKRREERLQAESTAGSGDRRTRLLQMGAAAVFLAIVAVVVLIVVNSGESEGGDASNLKDVGSVGKLYEGIPQSGLQLGQPDAKVELIEYGDLQCPVCKAFAEEVLPPVIEKRVKAGELKVIFRNFTIIGPQSTSAGAAALAAGEQGKGWQFLELFYRNQGAENAGYADDEFLRAIAKAVGVEDLEKFDRERNSDKLVEEVERTTEQAETLGLTGTPSLAIKGPSTTGLELLSSPSSPEGLEELVEQAS